MLLRLPKLLIVLALACSIGLHWAVLQLVAWTGMVITYSQSQPVTTAVAETFDGQHPCKLCKEIAKGRRSEKKSEYEFEASKIKFVHAPAAFIFSPPPLFWEVAVSDVSGDLLTHAPPIPPPRSFIG